MNPPVTWFDLGRVEYVDGLELQRQFSDARRKGIINDSLLLLEHPAVLTLGRGAHATNIVAAPERLAELGVETHETDRGGDVTYHGPGQQVGYPLLYLEPGRQDVRRYVRNLEEMLIRTVAEFGITATRIEKWPGVWVEQSRRGGPRKIAALGVHLSRWYTRHGFALNVQPDLSHFQLIVPCGITEAGVTSMSDELGRSVTMAEVRPHLVRHFAAVFECDIAQSAPPRPSVSVVIRSGQKVLLLRRSPARGGFWQPVTGTVEPGEALLTTAQRELAEETGLTTQVRPLGYTHTFAYGSYEPPRVGEETAFVVDVPPGAPVTLSAEHDAYDWYDLDAALQAVPHAGFKRALRLALAS